MCSNEPVKTKILYKDIGSARLGIAPWRFYNDKPANSQANDEGMTRRVITFVIRESVKKKDYGLKEKLISEIAGIYWWAMSMPEDGDRNVSPNPLASLGGIAETCDPGGLEVERKKSKKRSVRSSPAEAPKPEIGPNGGLIVVELYPTPPAQLPFMMEEVDRLT